MKNLKVIIIMAVLAICGGFANAQTKVVAPPAAVASHFDRNYKAAPVAWEAVTDGSDTYFTGRYSSADGDNKIATYKNEAYMALFTQIPIQYCPHSIKSACDTLDPKLVITDLFLVQSTTGNFYRATLGTGKKKKAALKMFYFDMSGNFKGEYTEEGVNKDFNFIY